jgi:signal transduction histidine kinase
MSIDLIALVWKQPAARVRRAWVIFKAEAVDALPIRWLVLLMAGFSATGAIVLAALIWTAANALSTAWHDVRKISKSDKILGLLESKTATLESQIHRYIERPSDRLLVEVLGLHGEVLLTLRGRAAADPVLAVFTDDLESAAEGFVRGFVEPRDVQRAVLETYEHEILKPSDEIARLLVVAQETIGPGHATLTQSLRASRNSFSATLFAVGSYHAFADPDAFESAQRHLTVLDESISGTLAAAENPAHRSVFASLSRHVMSLRAGLTAYQAHLRHVPFLVKTALDKNQGVTAQSFERLRARMTELEAGARKSFDDALTHTYQNGVLVGVLFLTLAGVLWKLQRMVETRRTKDLVSAHRRLAAQWARLRQANAFKSEVLGTVAHDLKNPLAVIVGRTEILEDLIVAAGHGNKDLHVQIDQIRASAKRLHGMVDDLLADAMVDALDIKLSLEPVDVALLAHEAAEANRPLAARKEQSFVVSAPPKALAICDADRIREAIDNLVSNAIKYSPCGAPIELAVIQEGDAVVIEVSDHGAGLSSEDIPRMFGRFQRLSAKPTAGENSTGLGLSIVKRIVDLHGGRIMVNSAGPGNGSTFRMILSVGGAKSRAVEPEFALVPVDLDCSRTVAFECPPLQHSAGRTRTLVRI